jgi:3-deoxy-D-manno-octulosonic-acid transferase
MRFFIALTLYRLLLPLLFLTAFPGWVVKMLKRGGFGTRLGERAAVYLTPSEDEPCGATHFHAVSVGEALLALKLVREWRVTAPERRFVLAVGTATGHAVATAAAIPGLRVTYAPLDFRWMVRLYLKRFEPSQIVLIEGEVWPHLLLECRKRGIPVRLVNARMSPRSAGRFTKFAKWLKPLYRMLDLVAVQEAADSWIWENLGIGKSDIHATGSLKFDPGSGARPGKREEFRNLLENFGKDRRVVLAASTHAGEDALIATAIREADPQALPVLVPRHAERRSEVTAELEKAGFRVSLRSSGPMADADALVIDTTGELRDWTAHADAVVIGKSFLSVGGQNPCEAILAGKPVILGPHMENFQPLADRLLATGGALSAKDPAGLAAAISSALDPRIARQTAANATRLLDAHDGATRRILALLSDGNGSGN